MTKKLKSSPQDLKYMAEYQKKPSEVAKRVARNKARREYEREHGDLPKNVEIDHKKMLKDGGTNAKSNVRPVAASENRGWRKGKSGY